MPEPKTDEPARASAPTIGRAEPFRSDALAAHRAAIAEHRGTAFIRYVPVVAGLRLRPVSLRSMERLSAFGCEIGRGRFEDLAIFVWVHHPAFGQFAWFRRGLVVSRLRRTLTPAWPRLGGFCVFAGKLLLAAGGWRAWLLGRPFAAAAWLLALGRPCSSEERLAMAVAEARSLQARARLDWPAPDDSGSATPLPCAFAAYVLNLVKGRHPGLTADEILDWPLVELVQWQRAIIAEANPRAIMLDATEARIIAAELEVPAEPAKERVS